MGRSKILVVDDNSNVAWAIKFVLQDEYDVDTIFSGNDAIKYVLENTVDLVLLDYHLREDVDGIEVLKSLHKIKPDLRAILVTGNSDAVPEDIFLGQGFIGYISKPFDIDGLKQIVRTGVR
jgi:DNA-binding NtrC family response regulator